VDVSARPPQQHNLTAGRATLPLPAAWYLHQADTDHFTAQGEHCQARRWRNPVEVTSHRFFRPGSPAPRVAEHFWCRQHGREFAARWGITVKAESERSARYLGLDEAARMAVEGAECKNPACHEPPTCIFTESYTLRGDPGVLERLYCNEHGWLKAVQWRIDIAPAPGGGESL
jgi:hypothetical protein